jgi:hypothetical protein
MLGARATRAVCALRLAMQDEEARLAYQIETAWAWIAIEFFFVVDIAFSSPRRRRSEFDLWKGAANQVIRA